MTNSNQHPDDHWLEQALENAPEPEWPDEFQTSGIDAEPEWDVPFQSASAPGQLISHEQPAAQLHAADPGTEKTGTEETGTEETGTISDDELWAWAEQAANAEPAAPATPSEERHVPPWQRNRSEDPLSAAQISRFGPRPAGLAPTQPWPAEPISLNLTRAWKKGNAAPRHPHFMYPGTHPDRGPTLHGAGNVEAAGQLKLSHLSSVALVIGAGPRAEQVGMRVAQGLAELGLTITLHEFDHAWQQIAEQTLESGLVNLALTGSLARPREQEGVDELITRVCEQGFAARLTDTNTLPRGARGLQLHLSRACVVIGKAHLPPESRLGLRTWHVPLDSPPLEHAELLTGREAYPAIDQACSEWTPAQRPSPRKTVHESVKRKNRNLRRALRGEPTEPEQVTPDGADTTVSSPPPEVPTPAAPSRAEQSMPKLI